MSLRALMELLIQHRHADVAAYVIKHGVKKGHSATGEISLDSYELMGVCWLLYFKTGVIFDTDCDNL